MNLKPYSLIMMFLTLKIKLEIDLGIKKDNTNGSE